jgi:hypothetical protein
MDGWLYIGNYDQSHRNVIFTFGDPGRKSGPAFEFSPFVGADHFIPFVRLAAHGLEIDPGDPGLLSLIPSCLGEPL